MNRDNHLRQLDQKLLSGEMTEEEEQEYKQLQEKQSAELNDAIITLARRRVTSRLPRFLRWW